MKAAATPMNPKILSAQAPVMEVKSCKMTRGMTPASSMRETAAVVRAARVPTGGYASKR